MAGEGDVQKEMASHQKSYDQFLWMMKWGAIVSMVIALGWMLLFS